MSGEADLFEHGVLQQVVIMGGVFSLVDFANRLLLTGADSDLQICDYVLRNVGSLDRLLQAKVMALKGEWLGPYTCVVRVG